MPQVSDRRKWLHILLTLAVAMGVVFGFTSRADADPPIDQLTWSGEQCADGLAIATLTASGNGRWATVVVEMRVNGGDWISLGGQYNPWRIEHEMPMTVSFSGDLVFRASDAKNNGSLMGEWQYSASISCP